MSFQYYFKKTFCPATFLSTWILALLLFIIPLSAAAQEATPPELIDTTPGDGELTQTVDQISITLADPSGIEEDSVIGSFTLENSIGQAIDGFLATPAEGGKFPLAEGWHRLKITIDHTKIDETLHDFPVYLDLSLFGEDFWSNVGNGSEIRITGKDLTTEMAREVVSCKVFDRTGEVHFKADSLSSSQDTVFYLQFSKTDEGDSAQDTPFGAQNVWADNYSAVYHLNEESGVFKNSTANEHDGVDNVSASGKQGVFGKGQEFNGSGDWINCGTDIWTNNAEQTASIWFNRISDQNCNTNHSTSNVVLAKASGHDNDNFELGTQGPNVELYLDTDNEDASYSFDGGIANDEWYNLTIAFQNGEAEVFINGTREYRHFWGADLQSSADGSEFAIGKSNHRGCPFQGYIDEVRISPTARSAAWIASEYENQKNPADFYRIDTVESENTFIFTPSSLPLLSDKYSASFTATDEAGNTVEYAFSFTVENQPPPPPKITGGQVLSGVISARPAENRSKTQTVTLTGTRTDYTSVWINGEERVPFGSGNWTVGLFLEEGENAIECYLKNMEDMQSQSVWTDIVVDTTPPLAVDSELKVDGIRDGKSAFLDWRGYNAELSGDINHYYVYTEADMFDSVEALEPKAIVDAGQQTLKLDGLDRDRTYYFVVVPIDEFENSQTSVTPVHVRQCDIGERTKDSLELNWAEPVFTPSGFDGYAIYLDDEQIASVNSTVTEYVIEGLEPDTVYKVGVAATGDSEEKYIKQISVSTKGVVLPETMGETGTMENLTHEETTVYLSKTYNDPVVFMQPLSHNENEAAIAKIVSVSGDRFTVVIQEASNCDGEHAEETASYLVLEKGDWMLPDCSLLKVASVNTDVTVGRSVSNSFHAVETGEPTFLEIPVVLSQVQSSNGPDFVKTRMRNILNSGFEIALEGERIKNSGHGAEETIGFIAVEPGQGLTGNHQYIFNKTPNTVNHSWYEQDFEGLDTTPGFLAGLSTHDGGDNCSIRYRDLSRDGVHLFVEEDHSTSHTTEVVDYFAITKEGGLTLSPFEDALPPEVVEISPEDGALISNFEQFSFSLKDFYGEVDIQAVQESLIIIGDNGETVEGSVSFEDDVFTFFPATLPLPDGAYTVTFNVIDNHGNTREIQAEFTVDSREPATPIITGGEVFSGTVQEAPVENISNREVVTLTGNRGGESELTRICWSIENLSTSILRVGEEEEYPTIQSAVDAASDGDLILIEPGEYMENVYLDKWIHIKGNTDEPANVVIRSPGSNYNGYPNYSILLALSTDCPFYSPVYIEGIQIESFNHSWQRVLTFHDENFYGDGKVIINRCNLIGRPNCYPVANFGRSSSPETEVEFKNCYFQRGYAHFLEMNSGGWSLNKCLLNNEYRCYRCNSSPEVNDWVSEATTGYGPDYGDWYLGMSLTEADTDFGTGRWSADVLLPQGDNTVEVWLEDEAGNKSAPVSVEMFVDSLPPVVTGTSPADNAFLDTSPGSVLIRIDDPGSGLNVSSFFFEVLGSTGDPVHGTLGLTDGLDPRFIPAEVLTDSQYTIAVQFKDNLENQGSLKEFTFTVDTTAPSPPETDPVTSPTNNPEQQISGTKDTYSAIRINGEDGGDHTQSTSWQHTLSLAEGVNSFTVTAVDRAGNESEPVEIEIVYDEVSPQPVETLTVDGDGDGTFVTLDWRGYDESLHGDIDHYRIYISESEFQDISDMGDPLDTVEAGTFTYEATGLEKDSRYWFAVMAVDEAGLYASSVTSLSATVADVVPPEDVTELAADSFEDRLVFSWTRSQDSAKDLSGYRIYFDENEQGKEIHEGQNTWEATGLLPATGYGFKITAVDADGNESQGVSITGATLLDNPADLTAEAFGGHVQLNWPPSGPSDLVSHYAVYVSATDFDSVSGMSPAVTANRTSAKVAGLENGVQYFFAVTTVNISNGEKAPVSTIAATPTRDETGPEIDSIIFNQEAVTDGRSITKSGVFRLETSDPAGVSRIEFYMDGVLKCTDYNPLYQCFLDIHSLEDGAHILRIDLYDSLGNVSTLEYNLNIAPAPPQAPVIQSPEDGYLTNNPELEVSGTAEKGSTVSLQINGDQAGDPINADESGNFKDSIELSEGENIIIAAAENRGGISDYSNPVTVTLNTAIPPAPGKMRAETRDNGQIQLSWNAVNAENIAGYHVYRRNAPFTSPSEAVCLTPSPDKDLSYTDLPDTDGTYYYRVTAESSAGNESALSNQAAAVSDSQAPYAISISYAPQGAHDPETGAMAPGRVDIRMDVSEPLLTRPFLSIAPEGGTPLPVELSKASDTRYTGFFNISDTTPSGTAWAVFSGRDKFGNRGTQINEGRSVQIDTHAPEVVRLAVFPAAPVRNEDETQITAVFGLDEPIAEGGTPQIQWRLSGEGRTPMPVDTLSETTAQAGDAQTWQAGFTLPADGGLEAPETLSFLYEGADHLGNTSTTISAPNAFQVYQGQLPPLATPTGLSGLPLPEGKIELNWEPVEGAAGYRLFRMGPDETALSAYGDPMEPGRTSFTDATAADGIYAYAIASIRRENDQTSQSAQSDTVEIRADSLAPPAPESLSLNLASNGIHAAWDSPGYTETITFSLYRSSAEQILSLQGLDPEIEGIEQENTAVVDPNPAPDAHCYAVAAKDAAGNISAPSNSAYLNFDLLPVSSLTVKQTGLQPPVLSWTHAGETAGCHVYLGKGENRRQVNSELISAATYTDTGYAEDERTYTVVAVDENGHESPARTITLPPVEIKPAAGARIKRGIMNALDYTLTSRSGTEIATARLQVEINGRQHVSGPFSLAAGATKTVPVIVGGYSDLPDRVDVTTALVITEDPNETATLTRTGSLEAGEGMLALRMTTEAFTRGGRGVVRFTLENTCAEPIEIITAQKAGKKASDEITVFLEDADGNIIAAEHFLRATGEGVHTLANGHTVARLAPEEAFASGPVELTVPANAPDKLTARVLIENIHYHHNRPDEVVMAGMSTTADVGLVDTAYYGEVTEVSPETSTGDTDVSITGRAIDRDTGRPLSAAPLNLVITNDGFEREQTVHTDPSGTFTYSFRPLPGESGSYEVSAVHPDLTERPAQAAFVISKVSLEYAGYKLKIPRNFEHTVPVKATAGMGTTAGNLRFEYLAEDQPDGVKPEGVHVTCGQPAAALYPQQHTDVSFSAWADNTADAEGRFVLRLVSDENPDGWRTLPVDFQFREAAPALWFAPDHVETGTRMGETVTETLSLENRGTAALENVTAKLVHPDGTAAPDWVYMPSSQAIGDIGPGQSHFLEVVFAPPETVSEDDYEFRLRLTSDNFETTDINLYAAVTRSGQGSVLFKVTDLYTGTLDADGEAIQGVENARICLQNEEVLTEEYSVNTDSLGEALLTDIPAGRYKYMVRADSHQQEIGRIWIKPGSTATEEVFLAYNLVTVEWEVTETTIEDKYEIILSATYETEVPAPVVVIEPASVSLPEMQAGDVFQGEFTLTNQGLVRADEVSLSIPADDEHFKYEFLAEIPESIQAKERITVPYRVTCLQPLNPALSADAGDATGGGKCGSYVKCAIVGYEWVCANGQWGKEAVRHCWTAAYGTDCGSSGGGGGGGSWGVGSGGGGWGGGSGSAPPVTEMPGAKCIPKCEDKCCEYSCCDPCETPGKCEKLCESVDSAVNLISGEYADEVTDLSVKVPGGTVSVERLTQIGEIRLSGDDRVQAQLAGFFHEAPLRLDTWSSSGHLEKIHYRGATYTTSMSPASGGWANMNGQDGKKIARVYTRGAQRITRIGEPPYQWRWEDRYGHWRIFDANGHLLEYGNRAGTLAEVAYRNNSPEDGISGVFDKNGRQVLWYEYNARGRIAAVEDTEGRRVAYTYGVPPGQDQAGSPLPEPLVSVTDVRGNITRYGRSGSSLTITHPDGGSKEISWDPEIGVVSSLSYSDLGTYTFGYDYSSRKKERYAMMKTPSGMVKEIWYSPENGYSKTAINGDIIQEKEFRDDGRTVLITDENGHTTRKEYNEWHQVTRIVHPDGAQESTRYDNTLHKPIRKTDARGIVTTYQHDEAGKLIRKTEAAGSLDERVTTYTYNADGNLTETRVLGTPDAITTMSYDDAGNMTRIIEPEGGVVRFTRHDAMGNVLTKIDARGEKWEYTYNSAGDLTAVIDPVGRKTTYAYDAAGNKNSETRPDGTVIRYAYDTRGNMTEKTVIIDPADESRNLVTEYAYTFDDKLARKTDPEGNTTLYEYDTRGRLTKAIDPAGNETAMQYGDESGCTTCGASTDQPSTIIYPTYEKEIDYDARGRKTAERDIAGQALETTYAYDAAGNLTAKTDKNGRTTYYAYDELNRLIRVTDPASAETAYEYDSRDNLISLTDAEGSTTRFEYDGNNRLVKEIRPQGEETAYAYDAAGNLAQKIDAMGQKTEYNYDAAGQLTEIRYYVSSMDNTPGKTVSFTYDANGNLTGYDDGSTSAQYEYDAAGRKVSTTVDYSAFEKTHTYTYLKNGKKESFTAANGVTYAYQYHNNRLTSVQIPDLGFITIAEYTWNRPAAMTYPGGGSKTFEYGPLMRIQQITAKDPAANLIMNYQYDYDPMDNITAKNTEHGHYTYDYDRLYRLTDTQNPELPELPDETFTYDSVGNRLSSPDTAGPWRYNPNNELTGFDDTEFEYDANGNMTRETTGIDETTTYVYNTENRLTQVWNGESGTGTLIARYYYDPFGRRLWKEVNGIRTYYMYADEGLVAEMDASGHVTKTYGWKPGGTWGTDPLFMAEDTDGDTELDYYFYHNDHLGTPQKMTDPSGAVVWSAYYSSFGKVEVAPESTVVNNLRFPGQYEDLETGLHYNWFRYYGPGVGRFLKKDPIGIISGINLYSYVVNNPNIMIDPYGLIQFATAGDFASYAFTILLTEAANTGLISATTKVLLGAIPVSDLISPHTLLIGEERELYFMRLDQELFYFQLEANDILKELERLEYEHRLYWDIKSGRKDDVPFWMLEKYPELWKYTGNPSKHYRLNKDKVLDMKSLKKQVCESQ